MDVIDDDRRQTTGGLKFSSQRHVRPPRQRFSGRRQDALGRVDHASTRQPNRADLDAVLLRLCNQGTDDAENPLERRRQTKRGVRWKDGAFKHFSAAYHQAGGYLRTPEVDTNAGLLRLI